MFIMSFEKSNSLASARPLKPETTLGLVLEISKMIGLEPSKMVKEWLLKARDERQDIIDLPTNKKGRDHANNLMHADEEVKQLTQISNEIRTNNFKI